ncbi:MAG: hypothetical protein JNM56_01045 [Planctomycetia bacterium]|nr:hypothetical protein [Planctomycetia bacterium]
MAGIERSGDDVWDRFFDFLYCEEDPPRTEVQQQLRELGIDMQPALRKVRGALEARSARTRLEAARAERPSLAARFGQLLAPAAEQLRDKLHELIARRLSGTAQAAYFRKLEAAASNQDLQSLLDDLHRLEQLAGGD